MITCCYKCQDRVVGCHSNCEKYKAEKVDHDQQIALIRERKKQESDITTSIVDSIRRRERRRR